MSGSTSSSKDWNIHHFKEVDSTSSWLKTNRDSLTDKTVAVADFQTAGRGRLGRKWVAPPGTALMFSMLVRPNWPVAQGGWLAMIAGLAAAEALSELASIPIQLKWPNDVVYMASSKLGSVGELHKMGGILSEAQTEDGRLTEAIIGVGLNINMTMDQLPANAHTPACSLRSVTGRPFEIDLIFNLVLRRFDHYYQKAAEGESPIDHWQNQLVTIGQPVTATLMTITPDKQPQKIEGVAVGVDEWGRLLITTETGQIEPVAAGDVTLRKG